MGGCIQRPRDAEDGLEPPGARREAWDTFSPCLPTLRLWTSGPQNQCHLFLKISNISHNLPSPLPPVATMVRHRQLSSSRQKGPLCRPRRLVRTGPFLPRASLGFPLHPRTPGPHPDPGTLCPMPRLGWFSPGMLLEVFVLLENSLSRQASAQTPPPLGKTSWLRTGPVPLPSCSGFRAHGAMRLSPCITPRSHVAVSQPLVAVTRCAGKTT